MWTNSVLAHNIYSPSFPISHCQHTWQLSKFHQHLSQFKSSVLGETQWGTARNFHPALLTHQMNFRLASFVVIMFQPITTGSVCDRQWGKELLLGMDMVQERFSSHQTLFAERIYIIKAFCVFGFFGSLYSVNIPCCGEHPLEKSGIIQPWLWEEKSWLSKDLYWWKTSY